jgi:hypothetical protein
MSEMFKDHALSTANYDALLIGWNAQDLQPNVSFHGGDSTYCHGESARQNMIDVHGWTITDGGKDCSADEFFSISGTISMSGGGGLEGVTITTNTGQSAVTNSTGDYSLSGLSAGTYVITPSKSGYTFSPSSLTIEITSSDVTGQNFSAIPDPPPDPDSPNWLLMFYIAGDDKILAESYKFIMSFLELGADNEAIKIIVLWDDLGYGNSAYYEIKYDDDPYNLAQYEEGVDKWSKGELNTGDPSTLTAFLAWAMDNYTASNYALIMDDHGSGLGGSMTDETDNDKLTLHETKLALSSIVSSYQKLDVLIMNACVMGLVEDGYQFKDVANYYVANEDIQWSYFHGYTTALDQIKTTTGDLEFAKAFVDGYADEQESYGRYYTMSVVDLSYADNLKIAIENLAGELNFGISWAAVKLWNITEISVQKFPSKWVKRLNGNTYIDLYHFAKLVHDDFDDQLIKDAAQNVMTAVDNYVVHNRSSFENAHGVSIFFPDMKSSYYTGENNDFASGTNWSTVSSTNNRSSEPIVWGNLLVNIFQEVDPEGPDNPNPPELLSKESYVNIYLPLIVVQE